MAKNVDELRPWEEVVLSGIRKVSHLCRDGSLGEESVLNGRYQTPSAWLLDRTCRFGMCHRP
eukprot:5485190-Amphidinium_carterae.1